MKTKRRLRPLCAAMIGVPFVRPLGNLHRGHRLADRGKRERAHGLAIRRNVRAVLSVVTPLRFEVRKKAVLPALFAGSLGALLLTWQPLFAANFTPSQERIWQQSQSLRPKPSTDTTPVTIKRAAVTYRIPRNYLVYLEPMIPTLKLTWPGLKPLTAETRKCFGSILQSKRVGCTSLQFGLFGAGSREASNAQKLKNYLNSHPKGRLGPFGYTLYEVGPEDARTETYVKPVGETSIIFFHCFIQGSRSTAVCSDVFRLRDGNWVHFGFRYSQRMSVAEIEAEMRALMESFRVKGETRHGINDSEPIDPKRN